MDFGNGVCNITIVLLMQSVGYYSMRQCKHNVAHTHRGLCNLMKINISFSSYHGGHSNVKMGVLHNRSAVINDEKYIIFYFDW